MIAPQSAAFGRFGFPKLGKFWTASNVLSLARMGLGFPLFYFILTRGPGDRLVIELVLAAVVTDWIDGRLARWSKTVSEWGKVLDPLADKIAGGMTILALAARGDTVFTWGFIVLLIVRDICIVGGAMIMSRRRGHVFMSLWSGKAAVALAALTVMAVLFQADPPYPEYLFWATTVLLIYSFVRYLIRFITYMRVPLEDDPGLAPLKPINSASAEQKNLNLKPEL